MLDTIAQRNWKKTDLTPEQEQEFQRDMVMVPEYRDYAKGLRERYREKPNYNDPQYDYRGAWLGGQVPQPYEHDDGAYHWESATELPSGRMQELKSPTHPTRWMQEFMQKYGIDPYEAGSHDLTEALTSGLAPGRLSNWPKKRGF